MDDKPGFEWTDEAVAKMRELREAGYSYPKIGIALGGISGDAVATKMDKLGWDRKALTAAIKGEGWTEQKIEKMRELWEAGHSHGSIGVEIGLTAAAVRHKIERLEWKASDRRATVTVGIRKTVYDLKGTWSEEEMRILREFMLAPELSPGVISVWVEASRRLPGRNPDAIRKKYVDMCDKNGWRRSGDAAIPVRVLSLESAGNPSDAARSQSHERRSPRAKRSDEWDDAKKAELRELWDRGLSTALIAERMRLSSKNAVIGQAHRMKLPARLSPVRKPTNSMAWSLEDLERLKEMAFDPQMWLAPGGFDAAAGEVFGRSPDAVAMKRKAKGWIKPAHIPAAQSSTKVVNLRPKFTPEALEEQAQEEAEMLQEAETGVPRLSYWQVITKQPSGCRWPMGRMKTAGFRWCNHKVLGCTKEGVRALRYDPNISVHQWDVYCPDHVVKSRGDSGARILRAALRCEAA